MAGFAGLKMGVGVVEAGTVVVGGVVGKGSTGVVGFEAGIVTIVGVGVYGGKFAGFVVGKVVEGWFIVSSSNFLIRFCSFLLPFDEE